MRRSSGGSRVSEPSQGGKRPSRAEARSRQGDGRQGRKRRVRPGTSSSERVSVGGWEGVGYAAPGRDQHRRRLSETGKEKAVQPIDDLGMHKFSLEGRTRRFDVGEQSHTVKRLAERALSHEEDRDNFLNVEYIPSACVRPVDFAGRLRLRREEQPIELFICVTVKDESGDDLRETLTAIGRGLPFLKRRTDIEWEDVAVCILVDGRDAASDSLLEYCTHDLRIYDESLLQLRTDDLPTTMHVFQRNIELPKHSMAREYHPPLQCILGIKELQGGKLNSHLWFFAGFCKQLQPTYVATMDIGVVPTPGSVSRLVLAMDRDPQVAGVTGEIRVKGFQMYNIWQAMQHFENKVQSTLDKPFEAGVGFVRRLPSAFSAYRWAAIRGEPLGQFFVAEEDPEAMGAWEANQFLTEDRILAFEVLTKKNRRWKLYFESLAIADKPHPSSLPALLEQRRRWFNGQLFNDAHYFYHLPHNVCCRSRHSVCRRGCLMFQYVDQLLVTIFRLLLPGSLFLTMMILGSLALENVPDIGRMLAFGFTVLYALLILVQTIVGLGTEDVKSMMFAYWLSAFGMFVLMFFFVIMSAYLAASGFVSREVIYAGLSFVGILALTTLIHGQFLSILQSFVPMLFLLPVYTTMIPIYAICRIHEATWVSRQDKQAREMARPEDAAAMKAQETQAARRRSSIVREGGLPLSEDLMRATEAWAVDESATPDDAAGAIHGAPLQVANRGAEEEKRATPNASQDNNIADDNDDDDGDIIVSRRPFQNVAGPSGGRADESRSASAVEDSAHSWEGTDEARHNPSGRVSQSSSASRRRRHDLSVQVVDNAMESPGHGGGNVRATPSGRSAAVASTVPPTSTRSNDQNATNKRPLQDPPPGATAASSSTTLPADVALVIAACRNGTDEEAHHVVLEALQQEAHRVHEATDRQWAKKQEIRKSFSSFRTRLLFAYITVNILWVAVIQSFSLTQYFATGMAGLVVLYGLLRFLGTLFYLTSQVFNLCIECWSAFCCCCYCCRRCGRKCGHRCCACCYRCAGPPDTDPYLMKLREEVVEDAGAGPGEGADPASRRRSSTGQGPTSSGGRRASAGGKGRRKSVVMIGDSDPQEFARNIADLREEQAKQARSSSTPQPATVAAVAGKEDFSAATSSAPAWKKPPRRSSAPGNAATDAWTLQATGVRGMGPRTESGTGALWFDDYRRREQEPAMVERKGAKAGKRDRKKSRGQGKRKMSKGQRSVSAEPAGAGGGAFPPIAEEDEYEVGSEDGRSHRSRKPQSQPQWGGMQGGLRPAVPTTPSSGMWDMTGMPPPGFEGYTGVDPVQQQMMMMQAQQPGQFGLSPQQQQQMMMMGGGYPPHAGMMTPQGGWGHGGFPPQ